MPLIAAALSDDVDHAAGAAAIFGGESAGEDGHLLNRVQWDVAEHGLAAPTVVAGSAVHFEPGLTASGAVGGEEILIHEHVALVDGWAIGGAEQREIGDAAVEQRRVFDLT